MGKAPPPPLIPAQAGIPKGKSRAKNKAPGSLSATGHTWT